MQSSKNLFLGEFKVLSFPFFVDFVLNLLGRNFYLIVLFLQELNVMHHFVCKVLIVVVDNG